VEAEEVVEDWYGSTGTELVVEAELDQSPHWGTAAAEEMRAATVTAFILIDLVGFGEKGVN